MNVSLNVLRAACVAPTDVSLVIHGTTLVAEVEAAGLGAARRAAELAAARWVMAGLRSVPEPVPALVDGPHDYTLAARRGAEFAARMAAREAIVGRPGFWWRVVLGKWWGRRL